MTTSDPDTVASTPPAAPSNPLNRRQLLGRGAAVLAAFGPLSCGGGRVQLTAPPPTADGALFLNETEMRALDALVERFIPEDLDPGAAAAGCADAINLLLSAFAFDPPLIFAGGPFSDRGGAAHNDFAEFVPLDRYETLAWRLKIEGSQGRAEREFNGPRRGWQQIYREGLAQLDARAAGFGFASFAQMPAATQDLLLRDPSDAAIAELIDLAFPHTLDAMYGAPEYGGNRDLAGWGFTGYDGDVQPRGYTDEEVTTPDNPGVLDILLRKQAGALPQAALLPVPSSEDNARIHAAFRALVGMSSAELALGMQLDAQSRRSRIRAHVQALNPERKA